MFGIVLSSEMAPVQYVGFLLFGCAALSFGAPADTNEDRMKRQVLLPAQSGPVSAISSITVSKGICPGGVSMGRACDAKRPWPQCPPQSYCYAVNTVDIGPYYCCPVWSTYGAAWRPQSWFYPYYPPNPYPFPWPAGVNPADTGAGALAPVPGVSILGGRKSRKNARTQPNEIKTQV